MHFHKTVYTDIFHNFIRFHWVSEICISKCFLLHTFCIRIVQIAQFYPYLTYNLRFHSFLNRALQVKMSTSVEWSSFIVVDQLFGKPPLLLQRRRRARWFILPLSVTNVMIQEKRICRRLLLSLYANTHMLVVLKRVV